jgi:hypothetical protein
MKRNLLNKAAAEKMIARVNVLQVDTKPQWGFMNATEMLLHCNLCNNQVLDGTIPYRKSTLKQRFLRIIALYIAPNFPKNLKTEPDNDTKGKIGTDQFESQKRLFIKTMQLFAESKEPIALTHPAFGNLNTTQWGIAEWKHTDHHLRQFGV